MTSLGHLLDGVPDGDLVHHDGAWTTREAIEVAARALAEELGALGVHPGEPVGVRLPDGPAVVAALFGVWQAGAVYIPINPRLTDDEVTVVLDAVRPAAVVVEGSVLTSTWDIEPTPGAPAEHDDDIALVQFTSGTTGRPKPVLLRHSGVLTLLDGVVAKLRGGGRGEQTADRRAMPNLIPVPLSLWAGIYNVLFAFRVGAPVVLLGRFDTTTFVDIVRRFEIRSTVLPPAAMTMLADDDSITDLGPLRYVRSITAPLSPAQARRFKDRFGITVLNGYGQTEIGGEIIGWSAADAREHGDAKLGSVGRPHADVEARTDPETSELQVRTPATSAGYADGNDLTDRLTDDGWFRTGDLAAIDDDGFVWIEGRLSDMINRGGLKVHPAEVEEVLRQAPTVADAAVIGVPDERLGEVPWAFVVSRDGPGERIDPVTLEVWCRQHLAPYKVPVRFEAIDALPRNEVGKVHVAALRASVAEA